MPPVVKDSTRHQTIQSTPSPATRLFMKPPSVSARAAFTLQDLLVLLATVAILVLLHLPSHANHRVAGQRASCLENLRQLTRAWIIYSEDNQGRLTGNPDGNNVNTNLTWAVGWLDLTHPRIDNTNWVGLMHSRLGEYLPSHSVLKCPADLSLGPVPGGERLPRVRSYSMNTYVGNRQFPYTSGYRQFRHMSDITDPSPAQLLVFLDERDDSINDACFQIDMRGFEPPLPDSYIIVDYPADRHNRAGNFAFADGHTETWRWQDVRTTPVHRPGQPLPLVQTSPNNPDVARIQAVSSRRNIP
jgi:prepilin-type processing-associated H-X9-DG protein